MSSFLTLEKCFDIYTGLLSCHHHVDDMTALKQDIKEFVNFGDVYSRSILNVKI